MFLLLIKILMIVGVVPIQLIVYYDASPPRVIYFFL